MCLHPISYVANDVLNIGWLAANKEGCRCSYWGALDSYAICPQAVLCKVGCRIVAAVFEHARLRGCTRSDGIVLPFLKDFCRKGCT